MLSLRRISTPRFASSSLRTIRAYSNDTAGPTRSGNPEGFNRREQASEDYYIKQHEKEQLAKLQQEISRREAELGDLKEKASKLDN